MFFVTSFDNGEFSKLSVNFHIGIAGIVNRASYFSPFIFLYPVPVGALYYWIVKGGKKKIKVGKEGLEE